VRGAQAPRVHAVLPPARFSGRVGGRARGIGPFPLALEEAHKPSSNQYVDDEYVQDLQLQLQIEAIDTRDMHAFFLLFAWFCG
jgi:hypothetical protein